MTTVSYRILNRIDTGGMAEIYKAIDVKTQKEYAIKRLLPELAESPQYVHMFLDEARVSLALKHPNIVSCLQLGKMNNSYFIAMEYVHGINLLTLLNFSANYDYQIPVHEAIHIASQAAKGLHYAHTKCDKNGTPLNIVHRDVTPPNILLSNAGEVKLIDFGLVKSRIQINKTVPGLIKGKFSYLSPEAAYGEPVDCRADIYSLGIILWEMLARRPLYSDPVESKILEAIRKSVIPDLTQINPNVTPELFEIIRKALQRDKNKRYRTALEFSDALETYAKSQNYPASELQTIISAIKDDERVKIDEEIRITSSTENKIPKNIHQMGLEPSADSTLIPVSAISKEIRILEETAGMDNPTPNAGDTDTSTAQTKENTTESAKEETVTKERKLDDHKNIIQASDQKSNVIPDSKIIDKQTDHTEKARISSSSFAAIQEKDLDMPPSRVQPVPEKTSEINVGTILLIVVSVILAFLMVFVLIEY